MPGYFQSGVCRSAAERAESAPGAAVLMKPIFDILELVAIVVTVFSVIVGIPFFIGWLAGP